MATPTPAPDASLPSREDTVGGSYSRYVLGVLVVVYVFNFVDRQIISILADEIKRDLDLSDAQISFLYGTVFAVFYAVFGLPLGRLADVWTRRSVIAMGLTVWSGMTALSGLAGNFFQLSAARVGVGVGEASATPAAFSMLSDYFPPSVRATVLAIYSSGIYIGSGIGIFIGGLTVDLWEGAFPRGTAPFDLRGWQVAFFVVGLPGLLLAIWVRTLREPVRGQSEGILTEQAEHPFREFLTELRSVLPPLTFYHLGRTGGRRVLLTNLLVAGGLSLGAWLLILWLGTPAQWIALGIGLYSAASWAQALALRDPPTFTLIFRTPTLVYAMLGFSFLGFSAYGIGFWTPPFFLRTHGISTSEAAMVLGLTAAVAGWLGITLGGVWCDRWRRSRRSARLLVGICMAIVPIPFTVAMLTAESRATAYVLNFFASVGASMWIGGAASTVQDLVLPRMRAIASATYILVITFVGLALGPYTVGRLSDGLGDLRYAMLLALLANLIGASFLFAAVRSFRHDEETRLERAAGAGEPIGTETVRR